MENGQIYGRITLTEKKRPNEKYALSGQNKPANEEELNFHYSRERRLEKAPQTVRNLYERPLHKFSLIGPLIADKPRATIFFTIVFLCVVIIMLSIFGFMGKSYYLEGNKIEITATVIDDVTLIILKKNINANEPYAGSVNIGVSPVKPIESDVDFPVFYHSVSFTLQEEERYSFTVPFNEERLAIVLQTEKSSLEMIIKPE